MSDSRNQHRRLRIATAVSLVLSVAALVFWTRSYWREDWCCYSSQIHADFTQTNLQLTSHRGLLAFSRQFIRWGKPDGFPIGFWYCRGPGRTDQSVEQTLRGQWYFAGFGWARDRGNPMTTWNVVGIPYWFVFVLLATAPARSAILIRRRRLWLNNGSCGNCGYDLRGTPNRCPECGTAASDTRPS